MLSNTINFIDNGPKFLSKVFQMLNMNLFKTLRQKPPSLQKKYDTNSANSGHLQSQTNFVATFDLKDFWTNCARPNGKLRSP